MVSVDVKHHVYYCPKYGIGGPEFGIKEELVIEKGRHLFQELPGTREAYCLPLGLIPALTGTILWSVVSQWMGGYCTPRPH